ncbi:MAG: carboxy-S-adenosyl-L-methionine synthase CmoA [Woeseiaceae bacterium]
MSKDEIYASDSADSSPFEFNEAVARVFPDMLQRSIPGYAATIEAIGALAAKCVPAGTRCYDLGCSLGAAALAMQRNISDPGCRIVAVDSAPAMVKRCRVAIAERSGAGGPEISVIEGDIRDVAIGEASMVVMNYTLQFLPLAERVGMLRKVGDGMIDGGLLVLSEKVVDADASVEALLADLQHDFKRRNAYSELEISRKRAALEDVLIPETADAHLARLADAGFRHAGVWLKYFNFVSFMAIK